MANLGLRGQVATLLLLLRQGTVDGGLDEHETGRR
jgi:hypothetical protein